MLPASIYRRLGSFDFNFFVGLILKPWLPYFNTVSPAFFPHWLANPSASLSVWNTQLRRGESAIGTCSKPLVILRCKRFGWSLWMKAAQRIS